MGPLRSLLNTPADRVSMVEKAPGYAADAVILDLEDSVALAAKPEARLVARDAITRWASDVMPVYVRANSLGSGMLADDLDAVVQHGLRGIQLPKVDTPETILEVDRQLSEVEAARGLPVGSVELLVSIESARGVFLVYDILTAALRVGSVMIGTARDGDLQGDVGYVTTSDEMETLYIRSRVVLVARAAGITNPIDGVYADVRDSVGFEASARRARELGYRGKKLIHPAQIEIAHRVFTPTEEELERYQRVLDAFDASMVEGRATAVVDGRMIDYAMVATARRMLGRTPPGPGGVGA